MRIFHIYKFTYPCSHSHASSICWLIDSGLDLEETVILDNPVVKIAEHISVVVDQLQELTRNRAQVILADSKTRGNLREGQNINYNKRTFTQREPT